MEIFGNTNVGRVRENNQDSFLVHKFNERSALVVVCDGMGGALAGDVASKTAVNSISKRMQSALRADMNRDDIKTLLTSAVNCANLDVFDLMQDNAEYRGMGTTVVAVYIKDGFAYIIHAGDSRAYTIRDSELRQITTDHSIVQQLIEQEVITRDEAKTHPKRNIITRALGVDEYLETDFSVTALNSGDYLVVCTDGLTNFISDEELLMLTDRSTPQEATEKLIELANQNGGGDNITAVVTRF